MRESFAEGHGALCKAQTTELWLLFLAHIVMSSGLRIHFKKQHEAVCDFGRALGQLTLKAAAARGDWEIQPWAPLVGVHLLMPCLFFWPFSLVELGEKQYLQFLWHFLSSAGDCVDRRITESFRTSKISLILLIREVNYGIYFHQRRMICGGKLSLWSSLNAAAWFVLSACCGWIISNCVQWCYRIKELQNALGWKGP